MLQMVLALLIGTIGAAVAKQIGAPMPYLIGAFVATGAFSFSGMTVFGHLPNLPMPVRNLFVAVIGVMIGGSFNPEMFAGFDQILAPIIGVIGFVFVALALNYLIFRRLGGYDRVTAFYSAMPGGLIENIALGEKAGGDAQILSLQQFSRIALVITLIPFLFLIFTGEQVGSAAGISIDTSRAAIGAVDIAILAACGLVGLYGGRAIKLPAAILVGPLILSGGAHYYGLTQVGPPLWAIAVAQVVVGTGLGTRFSGFKGRQIGKAVGLALVSVTAMLVLDVALVLSLQTFMAMPFDVLFISFAPGGVTETSLIALSLNANPVFVTTLHVFRIIVTVVICAVSAKFIGR
jgi:membrane AbrB-like protein